LEKTGFEHQARQQDGSHSLASVLSPSAFEVFEAPDNKPKQMQYCLPGADKVPAKDRRGFDVNGARSRPILEMPYLPVFGPADDFVPLPRVRARV
jgi:hypothetical protein